jgi:hypothetical protein
MMNLDLNEIMESIDPGLELYVRAKFNYQRLPEIYEQLLLKIGDAYDLCHYAINVLKEPWPEAEPVIKKNKHGWGEYLRMVKKYLVENVQIH